VDDDQSLSKDVDFVMTDSADVDQRMTFVSLVGFVED